MIGFLIFLYGALVGFVLYRLRKSSRARDRGTLALGWLAAAMSLTLAAALFGYAAWLLL